MTNVIKKIFGAAGPAAFTPGQGGGKYVDPVEQKIIDLATRYAKQDAPGLIVTSVKIYDLKNGVATVGVKYDRQFIWGIECSGSGRYEVPGVGGDASCEKPMNYPGTATGKTGIERGGMVLNVDSNNMDCEFLDDMGTEQYLVITAAEAGMMHRYIQAAHALDTGGSGGGSSVPVKKSQTTQMGRGDVFVESIIRDLWDQLYPHGIARSDMPGLEEKALQAIDRFDLSSDVGRGAYRRYVEELGILAINEWEKK